MVRLQKHKPYNFLHCVHIDFAVAYPRYGGLIDKKVAHTRYRA